MSDWNKQQVSMQPTSDTTSVTSAHAAVQELSSAFFKNWFSYISRSSSGGLKVFHKTKSWEIESTPQMSASSEVEVEAYKQEILELYHYSRHTQNLFVLELLSVNVSLCVCHLLSLVCAQQEVGVAQHPGGCFNRKQCSIHKQMRLLFLCPSLSQHRWLLNNSTFLWKIAAQEHFPSPLCLSSYEQKRFRHMEQFLCNLD